VRSRSILIAYALLLQVLPGGSSFPTWVAIMEKVFNGLYAFAVRGYLLLVLVGFMIYLTGLNDGLAKALVVVGVIIYIAGPYVIGFFAAMAGVQTLTIESATSTWLSLFGMADSEMVAMLLFLGDILFAICTLSGAILYFTPSSNDLKAKGHSLMVRALMLAPVLVFFNVSPWI